MVTHLPRQSTWFVMVTVRAQLKDDLGISSESISRIFTEDLKMSRVYAKFVSRVINQNKMIFELKLPKTFWNPWEKILSLERVITGDKIWVYGYVYETKAQSITREESRPKKTHQSRSNLKAMLTVFFDYQGIVHHEYAPQGRTINTEYYLNYVFKRLRDAVKRKRLHLWKSGNWLLHHDNASYSSDLIQDFLIKHDIVQLRKPHTVQI